MTELFINLQTCSGQYPMPKLVFTISIHWSDNHNQVDPGGRNLVIQADQIQAVMGPRTQQEGNMYTSM